MIEEIKEKTKQKVKNKEIKECPDLDTETGNMDEILNSDVKCWYPFNCSPLDYALGGGIAQGKIYELIGWQSVGKSTLALASLKTFIDYCAKNNLPYEVLWLESESVFDRVRAQWILKDTSKIIVKEPMTVEAGFKLMFDFTNEWLSKGKLGFIIWDTIEAAPTEKELETQEKNAGGMNEKVRLIKQKLRMLTNRLGNTKTTAIFVNQLIKRIKASPFDQGPDEESGCGNGLKFFASTRGKIRRRKDMVEILPNGEEKTVGVISELKTVKNKLAFPNQRVDLYLHGENGLDLNQTLLNFLKANKILQQAGSWRQINNIPTSIVPDGSLKFQSDTALKDFMAMYDGLKDYIDYLVLLTFTEFSVLLKIKHIHSIWAYEKRFFSEERTKLTTEEKEAAEKLYEQTK
jgi:RecA/RadA recombinase